MCGIVGFIERQKRSDKQVLKKMTDSMLSRGPDDAGYRLVENDVAQVGLGHRRLSILDLSSHGHQPMEFDGFHITYNGEVYNFEEIRDTLSEHGYTFESESDTEVILKAFHKWGVASVEKFRGMFAFCIVEEQTQKAYIFRDRAGVKPLYYFYDEVSDLLIYGSELKSFHPHEGFDKTLDKESIGLYLQLGYIPAPFTIFEKTKKIHAGHYIEYNLQSGFFEEKEYWNVLDSYKKEKLKLSEEEILVELESILLEAFELRMVSDVPVGTFLSGGIDSTLVTAILQKNSEKPLRTFTIGFDEEGYNEAGHAKEIASYLGTNHSEFYCTTEDVINIIHTLPEIYDEPFADDSAIPTILISKFAKEDVSVVLSGDGGDETFCGYSKYFALNKIAYLSESPIKRTLLSLLLNVTNETMVAGVNNLLPSSKRQSNIKEKYSKFKRAVLADTLSESFITASSPVDPIRVEELLKEKERPFSKTKFTIFDEINTLTTLEQMMLVDYQTYLVDEVLTKVDRATMSVSLEGREPLLDHKIIEYMAKIPIDIKYKDNTGKYLAKEILYKYVPKELMDRPKTGFKLPLKEWLKGDLRTLVDRYINKERLEEGGIFNTNRVLENIENYYDGKSADVNEIWHILNFEMWREKWL